MKQYKRGLSLIVGALIALSISAVTWAEHPFENRLPAWGDAGNKTIDFTNAVFRVDQGKTTKRGTEDSDYSVTSTNTSIFSLNSIEDGYINESFNGYLVIESTFTSRGVI